MSFEDHVWYFNKPYTDMSHHGGCGVEMDWEALEKQKLVRDQKMFEARMQKLPANILQ